ncbi:hypothetical protein RQP46_003244 [Phenoliferia psychrophenolica]
MSPLAWKAGASFCVAGIGAGAFGAHALATRLGEKAPVWGTASHYLMFNGVALLALSQHGVYSKRWGVPLIIGGAVMFSGSIFGLLLFGKERVRFLGPVTPLGGLLLLAGYTSLLFP